MGRKKYSRRNSYWGWSSSAPKKTIPADSGIRGGGKYGLTWWGQQWLNAFNQISDSNRLPRGRTYANNGSVQEIEIKNNAINAKVQGSYLYKVNIEIPVFANEQKTQITTLVQEHPFLLSKLLNRELPAELHDLCLKHGIHLFPASWRTFKASCSCPDWAMPCKHLAAVVYLIANEIDKNPFLVFDLHGFDLTKALSHNKGQSNQHDIKAFSDFYSLIDETQTADFQFDPDKFNALDFSTIPACRDNLLAILSEKPVFYPAGDFKEVLRKALTATAKNMQLVAPNPASADQEQNYRLAEIVEIRLNNTGMPIDFSAWDVEEHLLFTTNDMEEWENWLSGIPVGELSTLSDDLRAHWLAWRFAAAIVRNGAMTPQLLRIDAETYIIRWIPALLNEEVARVVSQFAALLPPYVLNIETQQGLSIPLETDIATTLLSVYLNKIIRVYHNVDHNALKHPAVHLFFSGHPVTFSKFEHREYPSAIALWLQRFYLHDKDFVPVLEIQESNDGFNINISIDEKTKPLQAPIPLKSLFSSKTYDGVRVNILRDLSLLGEYFPDIGKLLSDKGRSSLFFSAIDFAEVLFRTLPVIRLFGIRVLLPKSLSRILKPQASLKLSSQKANNSGIINLSQLLSYQWQVALGDHHIAIEEFLQLLKTSKGLVKLRDEYVYFDENETKKLAEKLAKPPVLNPQQLLHAALSEEYEGIGVQLSDELKEQIRLLLSVDLMPLPAGLQATLRPYQHRGYSWLCKNAQLGFGSILADDMGLGKTLQVIATLQHLKESGNLHVGQPALAIVPTTLLSNWVRETTRFAPQLSTAIYHGPVRSLEEARKSADLIITSYGVARSDLSKLEKLPWKVLVIDEAQNIKNPDTEQTKAVKKINAPIRIALSGTPVENRLSEYWSVFDFSNKGYLGGLKTFNKQYAEPIEINRDKPTLHRFQKATQPFVMRRLKSDKSIINDLPDKVEQNQFCTLSTEQAALYQNVVNQTLEKIELSEGIERKGLVLTLIMTLKQICNHPAHYLKNGAALPEQSGKCPLLLELLQQAVANNEKTLIFTQFREMGELLSPMIQKALGGIKPDFLHGGVSRKERDAMVERFQTSRAHQVMLLSLKAGGTGLNLTAASQVIHFDLWWNPAVEAQATDRAYRIGQQRNVQVHRFITTNTFEERINDMIIRKKELANLTVKSGETWIGDLSDNELRNLFSLKI